MTNKNIARVLITALVVGLLGTLVEEDLPNFADSLYLLAGVALYVFGFWASVRLYKN